LLREAKAEHVIQQWVRRAGRCGFLHLLEAVAAVVAASLIIKVMLLTSRARMQSSESLGLGKGDWRVLSAEEHALAMHAAVGAPRPRGPLPQTRPGRVS